MQTFVRVFGSLWLTIPTLLAIAVILILGTVGFGGIGLDLSIGAIRKDWYRAWWFQGLLATLAVNLITCTIKRKPWQIWQWGFITTHWGILMIIVGSMVSGLFKIYGMMPVVRGGSADAVQLEDERELELEWLDTGKKTAIPIEYNWYMEERPFDRHALDDATIFIKHYRPHVRPVAIPARPYAVFGLDAMGQTPRFSVEMGTAQEIENSPLTLAVEEMTDEQLQLEISPAKRQGAILILFGETKFTTDVADHIGVEQQTPDGHKVRIDKATPKGILLTVDGVEYAALPQGIVGESRDVDPPFEGLWRPPIFTGSQFAAVKTPSGWKYVITTAAGKLETGGITFGEYVPFPAGMPLQVRVEKFVEYPAIGKTEPMEPEQNVSLNPALFLRLESKGEVDESWILFDEPRVFDVAGRRLRVTFRSRLYREMGMTLKLLDARRENHPGSQDAAKYESDVEITDHKTGQVIRAQIRVNEPVTVRGYSFYMSSFDPGHDGEPPRAVFQVLHDPGTLIIYLGAIIAVSGTIFMFYLKPMILKARGELQRQGVPLEGAGFLHYLAAIPVPIAVIVAACLRNSHPRVVYRFGRAIAVTWIAATGALAAWLGIWVI